MMWCARRSRLNFAHSTRSCFLLSWATRPIFLLCSIGTDMLAISPLLLGDLSPAVLGVATAPQSYFHRAVAPRPGFNHIGRPSCCVNATICISAGSIGWHFLRPSGLVSPPWPGASVEAVAGETLPAVHSNCG